LTRGAGSGSMRRGRNDPTQLRSGVRATLRGSTGAAELARLAPAAELDVLHERRCAARLESIAGLEGVSADLRQRLEDTCALAAQAPSDRRFELEEARDAAPQNPDVDEDGE
jgi:hypothetical protein